MVVNGQMLSSLFIYFINSLHHKRCPPQKNYAQACNKTLREFFKTNIDNYLSEFSWQESKKKDLLHKSQTSTSVASQRNENEENKKESDEFFDTSETFLDDQLESSSAADFHPEIHSQDTEPCTQPVNDLKQKLHEYIDKQEDDLAARPGSIVQKFAADGRSEFFFIVNYQIPGSTTYNIASYYMTNTPIKDLPLLEKFVNGDDAFRNSRFKLLPHVTKLDIDVWSFALARGLASTALSCFSSLITETAFANTEDELPEQLYGASRLNHLDVSKALRSSCPPVSIIPPVSLSSVVPPCRCRREIIYDNRNNEIIEVIC
ncbi:hypothetical protein L1987_00536 [Smallanthus sonchifolius]|uniref:Uncharacterized protein n=1 Tax=Smallanthus sonchifolius TaxID=185202 RepID=A0ACB9K2M4_9ASTR|nr:hypothetical protein L1987_00536 [Smallanthus sonchifolius]